MLIVGAILIFVQSTLWESWCVCVCVCACVRACVNCKAFWASKKVSLLLLYFSPVSRSGCYWSGCIYIETVQCLLPRSIQPSETQHVPSDPTEKRGVYRSTNKEKLLFLNSREHSGPLKVSTVIKVVVLRLRYASTPAFISPYRKWCLHGSVKVNYILLIPLKIKWYKQWTGNRIFTCHLDGFLSVSYLCK